MKLLLLLSLGPEINSGDYLNYGSDSETNERMKSFMNRIAKMNKAKVDDIKALKSDIGQIEQVLKCSSQEASKLFQKFSATELNPANDAIITANFTNESQGAVAKLILDNVAGAGTINLGGGD